MMISAINNTVNFRGNAPQRAAKVTVLVSGKQLEDAVKKLAQYVGIPARDSYLAPEVKKMSGFMDVYVGATIRGGSVPKFKEVLLHNLLGVHARSGQPFNPSKMDITL